MGIVFFELLTGFMPFTGKNKEQLKENLNQGDYKLPKKLKLSLQGLHFLNGCLQFETKERFSWVDLINHEYIKSSSDMLNENDQMHLSYSEATGFYAAENL